MRYRTSHSKSAFIVCVRRAYERTADNNWVYRVVCPNKSAIRPDLRGANVSRRRDMLREKRYVFHKRAPSREWMSVSLPGEPNSTCWDNYNLAG